MDTVYFYLTVICMTLVIMSSTTLGFDESDERSLLNERGLDFELPRARSNTFLRALEERDDSSQDDSDDDVNAKARALLRRGQSNSSSYIDSKGRKCVLCKMNIFPCCEPSICKKHHIRFNECMEIKGR